MKLIYFSQRQRHFQFSLAQPEKKTVIAGNNIQTHRGQKLLRRLLLGSLSENQRNFCTEFGKHLKQNGDETKISNKSSKKNSTIEKVWDGHIISRTSKFFLSIESFYCLLYLLTF